MPALDFVTLYVTGPVGNNNTVVATVIPPLAACSTPTSTSVHVDGTAAVHDSPPVHPALPSPAKPSPASNSPRL